MTHVNIPQCVGAQVKCYNMTLKIKMISTLTSFAADLFKYNQRLPDNLHDLSSSVQCQCKRMKTRQLRNVVQDNIKRHILTFGGRGSMLRVNLNHYLFACAVFIVSVP